MRNLEAQRIALVYVTQRLGEVKQICDRFTVLRYGKYAGEGE